MDEPTPPLDTFEQGQLNVQTLDEVAPRLRTFTAGLIERLRACDLPVTTTQVFLLNSSDHPIEVPGIIDGVTIQMNFDATLPTWAPDPRARLQVSFNDGRRYFYTEVGKTVQEAKFPMNKVLTRFLTEVRALARKNRAQGEQKRKADQAQQNLAALREQLQVPEGSDLNEIRTDNLRIRCLPQTPTLAIVMVTVPYDQAAEIAQKYRQRH